MENQGEVIRIQTIDDIFTSALNLSAGLIFLDELQFDDNFTVKIRLRGEQ